MVAELRYAPRRGPDDDDDAVAVHSVAVPGLQHIEEKRPGPGSPGRPRLANVTSPRKKFEPSSRPSWPEAQHFLLLLPSPRRSPSITVIMWHKAFFGVEENGLPDTPREVGA